MRSMHVPAQGLPPWPCQIWRNVYLTWNLLQENPKEKSCDMIRKKEKKLLKISKKKKNTIQKGNAEARMCVENAVCQKNKAILFLRVSAKVETASARVQTEALRRFLPLLTHLNANLKHWMFKHHGWKEKWEGLQARQRHTTISIYMAECFYIVCT